VELSVTVAADLTEVDQPNWDRLAAGFYQSYRWLRAVHDDPGVESSYLLAHRGDTLVGALPIFDVSREGNSFYAPARHHAALTGSGHWLLAGTRRGYRNGLLCADADRRAVLAILLAAARELAADRGADGLVWMFAPTPAAAALRDFGAVAAFDTVDASITANNWDEYESALSGRRRAATRRERRRFAAAGYDVAEQSLATCWKPLAELVSQVQKKHGHGTTAEQMRDVLARQLEVLGPDSLVITIERDGALVAGALDYRFGDTLYGRMVGFDYPRLVDAYEYFNLVYYLPIERLPSLGLRRLHLGIEAEAVKVERGAQLDPLWTVALPTRETILAPAKETVDRAAGWRRAYGPDVLPPDRWDVSW
jgi:predicted N-acyltransferase